MIPRQRLLNPKPLYAARGQTSFTPETLFLGIGIGQPVHVEDNAIATLVHEGIHWRQFQGTTFGAFCQWLEHSQEINTYSHIRALPADRKRQLLRDRASGVPILALGEEDSLPAPPISTADLQDRVNLLRTVWYDHLFTYRYFRNAPDILFQHADPAEIFSNVIADAATTLPDKHPAWTDFAYTDIQEFYRLDSTGKVADLGKELGTKDLLEAAAAANELLFKCVIEETRFRLSDEGAEEELRKSLSGTPAGLEPKSVATPRDSFDRDIFDSVAPIALNSSYGYALQVFFKASGLAADRHESWLTALAVLDFALNGPLPPLVLPGGKRPNWDELYPPARFLKASFAARKLGRLSLLSDHRALKQFLGDLAAVTGLSNPVEYNSAGIIDAVLPDFDILKNAPVWDATSQINYYTFLRWCQQSLWRLRTTNLPALITPATSMWRLMSTNMAEACSFVAGKLSYTSPIIFTSDGEIGHGLASTTQFGTWLALSKLIHYASAELMVGSEKPDFGAFPATLLGNERGAKLLDRSMREALDIDYDPWNPAFRPAVHTSAII